MNDESAAADGPEIRRFFDRLTDDYAAAIERCFPRYREMLWALLTYLPSQRAPQRILELGSGTGNLTVLLSERYPQAELTCIDISADSLQVCQQRMPAGAHLQSCNADMRHLDFADSQFDLVISSIAIHHLDSIEKKTLFNNIHGWLAEDGVFAYADQHAGGSDELNQKHLDLWNSISRAAGSSPEEWQMWMEHQRQHDHHDTLTDQIQWLSETGFRLIDCPWRYLLWTVLICQK